MNSFRRQIRFEIWGSCDKAYAESTLSPEVRQYCSHVVSVPIRDTIGGQVAHSVLVEVRRRHYAERQL